MGQNPEVALPSPANRLFGVVMAWTVFTTVFVWLPIVRALARPDGYQWGFFGLRGEGLSGPFWIFPPLALYSALLFGHAWWGHRGLFRSMLLLWHIAWAGMLIGSAFAFGNAARWQGQGWGFDFPIPIIALAYSIFTLLVILWAVLDWRQSERPEIPRWTPKNSRRLGVAVALLPVAYLLFRLGTNYNWVTALAIGVTIVQWVTFSEALEAPLAEGRANNAL
ncbi:MAG: hypothetical protein AAF657_11850 [Acidobacteriota bacterium]